MQSNDQMCLLVDFKGINLFRYEVIIFWLILTPGETASQSDLFPFTNPAHVHIIKETDKLFKGNPEWILLVI